MAEESVAMCQKLDHRQGLAKPLTVLGEVYLELGDFERAEHYFHEAIKTANEAWTPPYALHALIGLARLLATVGQKVEAYETAAFILHHPASWQWSKSIVAPLAAELEAALPAELVAKIQHQVPERTLEEMMERVTSHQILEAALTVSQTE